jgi:intergrase/recombinase
MFLHAPSYFFFTVNKIINLPRWLINKEKGKIDLHSASIRAFKNRVIANIKRMRKYVFVIQFFFDDASICR